MNGRTSAYATKPRTKSSTASPGSRKQHRTQYMAEQISIFGIVVGIALLLTGIGLVILAFAVFGRAPQTTGPASATR